MAAHISANSSSGSGLESSFPKSEITPGDEDVVSAGRETMNTDQPTGFRKPLCFRQGARSLGVALYVNRRLDSQAIHVQLL
jgi:hypothetical protein